MNDRRQWILYSAPTGDSLNLFRAPVSPSGEILAGAEQLTAGAGLVPGAALSPDGKVAFASASLIEHIYAIPIATERVPATRRRLPRYHGLRNNSPSISRDGRWLAYAVTDLEYREATIRLRDLVDGTDRLVVEHLDPRAPDFISISPDGSKVVFSDFPNGGDPGDGWSCFVVAAGDGIPQRISRNCRGPRGFSSDGSIVLVQKLNKTGPDWIAAVNLVSKQEKSFLSHSHDQLYHAFLSWDDRQVVFKAAEDWNHGRLLMAPVRDGVAGAESEWIAVTDGRHADDKPQFSPDGNQIYFTSDRDGYLCLWAQPLNHVTRHAEGTPYVVQHFHDVMGWFLKSYNPFVVSVGVARDKIVTNLVEVHSDIWMMHLD
jgi:Tol biopolymer transport system component